jgi:ABC-2 type transport system ATP-binding protein
MHMKVALASALAYRPKLIVLDEPFGGLDPLVRDEVIEGLLERASEATILVSSHDLAEIENLASHIGYLDQGSLRLSEEMTALAERFREVELSLDRQPVPPEALPSTWMQVSTSASVLRFVETVRRRAHDS